jgi:hypothetical protein
MELYHSKFGGSGTSPRNPWAAGAHDALSGSMIAVPQNSAPHPCGFLLSRGWETALAGYSVSGSGLAWLFRFT